VTPADGALDVVHPDLDAVGPSDADVGGEDRADVGQDSAASGQSDAVGGSDAGALDVGPDGPSDRVEPDLTAGIPDACAAPSIDVGVRDGVRNFLDLVVMGQGFEEHEGKRVHVFTRESSSNAPLGYGSALVQDGRFTIRFPDGYARFSYQLVFHYVDVNGDGRCAEAMGDHVGYRITNGFNPSTNEPLEMMYTHTHVSASRNEQVCDLMNTCR
jgi:hypothetical protein